MKENEVNVKIKDKEAVKNIQAYCSLNKMTYSEFMTKVAHQFFSNERVKLELLSKDQLIEVIMAWKEEQ